MEGIDGFYSAGNFEIYFFFFQSSGDFGFYFFESFFGGFVTFFDQIF